MDLRAVIFVPALVGSVILGFVFLLFASHYYLSILEGTGAGAKEIPWEGAPVTDNFTKVFYLGWLIGLWTGPAYFMGRVFASGTDAGWLKLAVPLLVMWVLYPLSQLSSLSASSVWVPMNLDVFTRLAQKPIVTAGFFALTLPVFGLFGLGLKWAYLTKGEFELLFAGVPLMVFAALMYARLLGRLAFVLMFTKDLLKSKKKKKPKAMDATPPAATQSAEPPPEVADMTPIMTPLDGELTGYAVLMEDDPPAPKKRVKAQIVEDEPLPEPEPEPEPRPKRGKSKAGTDRSRTWTDDDEDASPYGVNAPEGKEVERVPADLPKPSAEEIALYDRRDAVKAPKQAWTLELLVFWGQPGTISALLILSALGVFAGVMVRVARAFDPTSGPE